MSIALKRFPRVSAVNYDQFRNQIRSGDLMLCSGSGVFSRMIQAGTGSTWSHVGFVMRLQSLDRVMVLESLEPLGVRTVPLRKYIEDYNSKGDPYPGGIIIARHEQFANDSRQAEKLRKFSQFAVDLFGYPYDKDEIARIAARIVATHIPFKRDDERAIRRDREYICSEYVWECYKKLGIQIEHNRKGFIAPADFASAKGITLQAVLKAK